MTFTTEAEIDRFLADFEAGTIPKEAWTHRAHVAVAGAYVWRDPAVALVNLLYGILFLNPCHGTRNTPDSGYHETLTVFWVSIVRDFCRRRRTLSRLEVIQEMMETLPSGLFNQYYGFDVVKSRPARERWVEPDIQSLPDHRLE